ncbi:hypothetical protein BSKO_06870 [Bryopsis sp. KO-2023]|nr:hypothetical protein BSKO_06870 [Bryopsis sp. KO-2023]
MASSRLCIRGLPKHVGEKDLRDHFSGKWTLTDVKIARTREGQSRQLGFVGFETTEDAASAKKYFNKSYMGVTKLVIEFARQMNAATDARPWSKYSKGSSANAKLEQNTAPGDSKAPKVERPTRKRQKVEEDGEEEDPKLKEFLDLMQPRSKMQSWGNADSALTAFDKGAGEEKDKVSGEGGSIEMSDAEETADKGGEVALSDMDYLRSKMRKDFDAESEDGSEELEEILSGASSSELEEIFSDEDGEETSNEKVQNPPESTTEHDDEDLEELKENPESTSGRENEAESAEDVVSRTKRLFVRNLSYKATEADLISLFEEFGDIVEVNLAVDKRTERSKGFALIHFSEAEAAIQGFKQMDGRIFQGRLMHVLPGEAPPEPADDPNEKNQKGGFKSEKAAKEKANLGNRSAWNTLFMRPDTVTEAIAAHYGVSKSELMDRDASDLGVRMALGETQIIAKTKDALGDAGVSVEKMEEAAAAAGKASSSVSVSRSSTTLLIKNLPYMTEREELQGMFGDIGPLLRLVLPPTKVLAIVEFQDSSDAQRAFRCLSYRKYHGVPIYLEWAPRGIFMVHADRVLEPLPAQKQPEQPKEEDAAKEPVAIESVEEVLDSGDETSVASATVFVKNLSFTTTEAGLRSHFDNVVSEIGGKVNSTVVATKLRSGGKRVSAGYGFVEVDSDRVVKHVIKTLQGSLLDGHKLELQRSLRKSSKSQLTSGAATTTRKRKAKPDVKTTKLIVRNLAFEATKQDIMGLFGPFGHIKTCRLPKKFDGTHRGFAFVDFVTKQEAESAKDGVTGAHLYGRRLVIEYAKEDDESVDALRAKTARKFNAGEGLS